MSTIAHKSKRSLRRKEELTAYLMLLFPILWWGVFFLFAFVRAIYFSFTDLTVDVSRISSFNFNNYIRLFKDEVFLKAIKNTLVWTVVMTLFNNVFGILIAFFISRLKKGQKLFLTLLFWPTLASAVASSNITMLIFNPSDSGVINSIIIALGGEPLAFYNDPKISLFTLMIIPALLGFSTQMMIYYVAIKGVDKTLIEAARIDGASDKKIFTKIYVPLITPSITYNLILSIISGIKVIAPMQLVSKGGPLDSSMSIMLYLYNNTTTDISYACSIGVITLIIILVLTYIQIKITKRKDDTK